MTRKFAANIFTSYSGCRFSSGCRFHVGIILIIAGSLFGCGVHTDSSAVQVNHLPKRFSRRYGDFTANICGILSPNHKQVTYKVNDSPWSDVKQDGVRVPAPLFTIELTTAELRQGMNKLEIKALRDAEHPEVTSLEFAYDASPISLPLTVDWSNPDLDVQDGYWETFKSNGDWRVRPKSGFEDYDRVLVVTGAFSQGRRIETDVIFHKNTGKGPFGFGVLPLWGGRPDDAGVSPRRGWNFSLAWFYSWYNGIGMEFSYKYGAEPPLWISSYKHFNIETGKRYFLTMEAWPERNIRGDHLRYRQRMKWRAEGELAPKEWIEISDVEGAPLPAGEYGVALVAHRCSVEFGPVTVEPIQDSGYTNGN